MGVPRTVMNPAGPPVGATGGYALPQVLGQLQALPTYIAQTDQMVFAPGGPVTSNLIRVGYLKAIRVVLRGTLNVNLGTGTAVAGDPRNIVQNFSLRYQGINQVRALPSIGENIIDGLDFPVLSPKQQFSVNAGANPFYLEFTLFVPISETNMLCVIYEGGGSTYPQLQINCNSVSSIVTTTGNAAVTLDGVGAPAGSGGATFTVYTEWIDLPAPAPARTYKANGQDVTIPPQGLYRETLKMKQSQLLTTIYPTSPNYNMPFELPRSPIYSRIVLLSFVNNQLDVGDMLLSSARLDVQQITALRNHTVDLFDMEYRQTFFKPRPGGVYVWSFIDKTSSDRDLLYTETLGKFTLSVIGTGTALQPNSYIQVLTETLVDVNPNVPGLG